jgi:hypothetical protein
MHIIFNRHPGGSPGRLAWRADINIKPRFRKKSGHQFGVMIMAFIVHATDQDPWSPPFPFHILFDSLINFRHHHFVYIRVIVFGKYATPVIDQDAVSDDGRSYLFKSELNVKPRYSPG